MKNKNLKISLICLILLSLSACKFTGEKLTPVFLDFSKQTANIFRAKPGTNPLEFEIAEQGVPFAEIERRILKKEMEPLVSFPISQMQEARRQWENAKPKIPNP